MGLLAPGDGEYSLSKAPRQEVGGRFDSVKYTRGSWTYVEKGAACEETANRTTTIVYRTDGTMTLDDTVLNWRNTLPCGD